MPTVIGVNQVSGRMPPKSKWYQDVGRIQGRSAEKLTDAFLAFITAGAAKGGQQPIQTPSNPGSLQFPSGATTTTSPQEMAQIQAMGGVPTTTGEVTPVGRPGATIPSGVNFIPPIPQNIEQAKYLSELAKIDPNAQAGKTLFMFDAEKGELTPVDTIGKGDVVRNKKTSGEDNVLAKLEALAGESEGKFIPPDAELVEDANGNRAYKLSDGSFVDMKGNPI